MTPPPTAMMALPRSAPPLDERVVDRATPTPASCSARRRGCRIGSPGRAPGCSCARGAARSPGSTRRSACGPRRDGRAAARAASPRPSPTRMVDVLIAVATSTRTGARCVSVERHDPDALCCRSLSGAVRHRASFGQCCIDRIALVRVSTDFLIVGSGVAGLRAAIALAEVGDVLVLTKADPGESNTGYAQGGVAAAVGPDDSPELHARDTMAAGDGLCRREAVRRARARRPALRAGAARLGRGVRSRCRRGAGAGTRGGAQRAPGAARPRRHRPRDRARAVDARVDDRRACACSTWRWCWRCAMRGRRVPRRHLHRSRRRSARRRSRARTLLATGGAGQVFRETTNPAVATGDGMAMAFEAGARVADLEFVQFHPTVLSVAGAPRFLLSEALRGEGGRLLNAAGERFVERYDPAGDLAPRDRRRARHRPRADRAPARRSTSRWRTLDPDFVRKRFPTIAQACRGVGLDLATRPDSGQPGRPLRDGRRRDRPRRPDVGGRPVRGRRSGLHRRARRQPPGQQLAARGAGVRRPRRGGDAGTDPRRRRSPPKAWRRSRLADVKPASGTADEVRELMWHDAGLLRSRGGLDRAAGSSRPWRAAPRPRAGTVRTIAASAGWRASRPSAGSSPCAALRREESRGGHFREDFPRRDDLHWIRRVSDVRYTVRRTRSPFPDRRHNHHTWAA